MKKGMVFATFMIFLASLFAETNYYIDYYGVSSKDLDKNMADMTSDLYFTQLCEIKNFSVSDKRGILAENTIPEESDISDKTLAFYTVISKKENSTKWIATLNIINKLNDSRLSSTKEFDSYYKILMEGKKELQDSFIALIEKGKNGDSQQDSDIIMPPQVVTASTENLAGTWSGENNIEKILIMRGGRGFIIFKNGASMNITVKIEDSMVVISQTGKPNASFFPDLPRQTAIEAALTAAPITWKMKLTADNTLVGVKNTLMPDGDSFQSENIDVEWNRKL